MIRSIWGIGAVVLAVVGMMAVGSAAAAVPGPPGPTPVLGGNTVLVLTGTGEGQAVTGSLPSSVAFSDPTEPYPSTPPPGHVTADMSFAGIIEAQDVESLATLRLYCIDIHTDTYIGLGYESGTWEEAGMPNVGYVARLLTEFYPTTGEPALVSDDERAAAVQAAIWYFTDYYVVNAGDPLFPLVEEIVNDVRVQDPLDEPSPPALSITPASAHFGVGTVGGPFTVHTDSPSGAELTVTGGTAYSDAGASTPVPSGTVVPDGQQLWVLPDPGGTVTLAVHGTATVPSGNVFLYDHDTPSVSEAQRLILAADVVMTADASVVATFGALGEEDPELAATGSQSGSALLLAGALAIAGVALIALRRQSRRQGLGRR